jgi:hypothetical protein
MLEARLAGAAEGKPYDYKADPHGSDNPWTKYLLVKFENFLYSNENIGIKHDLPKLRDRL